MFKYYSQKTGKVSESRAQNFLIRIKMSRCWGAKLSAFNSLNILLKSKSLRHTLKYKPPIRVPKSAGDFFPI